MILWDPTMPTHAVALRGARRSGRNPLLARGPRAAG